VREGLAANQIDWVRIINGTGNSSDRDARQGYFDTTCCPSAGLVSSDRL